MKLPEVSYANATNEDLAVYLKQELVSGRYIDPILRKKILEAATRLDDPELYARMAKG